MGLRPAVSLPLWPYKSKLLTPKPKVWHHLLSEGFHPLQGDKQTINLSTSKGREYITTRIPMNYPKILSEIIPESPPQTYLRKSLFEISLSHISTKRFPPMISIWKIWRNSYYILRAAARHNPSKLGFCTRLARKLLKQEIYLWKSLLEKYQVVLWMYSRISYLPMQKVRIYTLFDCYFIDTHIIIIMLWIALNFKSNKRVTKTLSNRLNALREGVFQRN